LKDKNMKIESTFDIKSSRVEITFDPEIQNLLLAASRAIAAHFDAKTFAEFCRDLERRDPEYDWDKSGRLLLELIRSKTRIVEADSDQMQGALTFLCICTVHMLKAGRATSALEPVLTVLANLSPFPVLQLSLPPASEVFDRHKTPKETWKIYQTLQSTSKSETPYLSVAQGYELALELKKTPRLRSSLKTLLVFLDASSLMYRMTVEALASANKASEEQGKAKK
jgi:hypothetical protein